MINSMATEYNFDTFEKETKELVATLKRLNDEIEK